MIKVAIQIVLCLHLLLPLWAHADAVVKDPLNFSLRQYGLILCLSIFGGIVSWYAKVRKGEASVTSIGGMIGEVTTSAFAGLIAFYLCEFANLAPLLTAACAGMAGHAGPRGVAILETYLQRKVELLVGNQPSSDTEK